ncbi:MAG: 50S ribosomal protein L13 [Nanoarchaeota archaeon]
MNTQTLTIDAENAVAGRLASFIAKQLLLGKTVNVVNCEKAIIIGRPADITGKYLALRRKGGSAMKGPLFPSTPERIMKRIITGMLPHKKGRGEDAEKRIKCYEGIPETLKDQKLIKSSRESVPIKSITIKELSIKIKH